MDKVQEDLANHILVNTRLRSQRKTTTYSHASGYDYIVERSMRGLGVRMRFSLSNDFDEPSAQEFSEVIRGIIDELRIEANYSVRNITFGFLCDNNRTTYLSIPRSDINEKGIDNIIALLAVDGHENFADIYEDYTGSISSERGMLVTTTFVLHMAQEPSGGCSDGDNCLIDCFNTLTNVCVDPQDVRMSTGIRNGPVSIADLPLLEAYYGIDVCVIDDDGNVIHGARRSGWAIRLSNAHYEVVHLDKLIRDVAEYNVTDAGASDVHYYFFDFETVWKPDTLEMVPYAYSIIVMDRTGNITDRDMRMCDPDKCNIGASFAKYICENAPEGGEVRYLVGYNNSRFDNYILVDIAAGNNLSFGNDVISGTSILFMTLMGFRVKDLYRFTGGSLDNACKDFGCANIKGSMDHQAAQEAYIDGRLGSYIIKHMQDIYDYCIQDVLCLAELYFIVKSAINDAVGVNIDHEITLPSMMYKELKRSIKDQGIIAAIEIPILDQDRDKAIRRALIGGRTQVFKHGEHSNVVIIDRISQYPHVMMTERFPIGKPIKTAKYIHGKIGVYEVIIHSQPDDAIVPLRGATLEWKQDEGKRLETYVTNVEIDELLLRGHKVDIGPGIYWREDIDSPFRALLDPILDLKRLQDMYKETGDVRYNAGIRACMKRMVNSLSGKLIQRTHVTKCKIVTGKNELKSILESIIGDTMGFTPTRGNAEFVFGRRNDPKPTTPTIWGMLIYAYARRNMYRDVIERSNTKIMTDTDSLAIHVDECEKFASSHPQLFGDQIGQFRIEAYNVTMIAVAPKCYCTYVTENDTERNISMIFKGVRLGHDKIITDNKLIERLRKGKVNTIECDAVYNYEWSKYGPGVVSINTYRSMIRGESLTLLCSRITRELRNKTRTHSSHLSCSYKVIVFDP